MGHFHHQHQHSSSWYNPLPRLTVTSLVVKWKSTDGEAEEVLVVCFVVIVHHIFIVSIVVIGVIALWHLSTLSSSSLLLSLLSSHITASL